MVCAKCTEAGRLLSSEEDFEAFDLGTYGEAESRKDCTICQQIISIPWTSRLESEICLQLRKVQDELAEYHIMDEEETDFMVDIVHLDQNEPTKQRGVVVDAQEIDFDRLTRWLDFCAENHHGECHSVSADHSIDPVKSILLIDVEQECLVQKTGMTPYFALSYVWGHSKDTFETRIENLDLLKCPGSLGSGQPYLNRIPETIRDSMRLVRSLGHRYLWVDRLCIVQDNWEHKMTEIQNMGSIYWNAVCTIVAADGQDADHGLGGIGDNSRPRTIGQTILDFPSCPMLVLFPPERARGSRWNTRGWTFQERYLSRRSLFFTKYGVAWHCQAAQWMEDITDAPDGVDAVNGSGSGGSLKLLPRPWPDLQQWITLAVVYNKRQLTYDSDIMNAFAGIESVLAKSFPGGFSCGIPLYFFDACLLWQPISPMTRRYPETNNEMIKTLPSWSWVGWRGPIDPKSMYCGFDYLHKPECRDTTWRVYPIIQWSHDVSDSEKTVLDNYSHLRVSCPEVSAPPSSGWVCNERESKPPEKWFTHPHCGEIKFNYPVPVNLGSPGSIDGPILTTLNFKTSRRFMTIGRAIPGLDLQGCMSVSLLNSKQEWAGVLRLNIAASEAVPSGEVCELIAISRGTAINSQREARFMEEWNLIERPKENVLYEFFHVLWIEREENRSFRKALGRVERMMWEEEQSDLIDIELH